MDSLKFENFALISVIIYLDNLFMGSGELSLKILKIFVIGV